MEDAELQRVFQMFDRDRDGLITLNETSDSLENLGMDVSEEAELADVVEKVDANGGWDVDEFGALYGSISEERDEEEGMREAFDVFEWNGDGFNFITAEEPRAKDCRRIIGQVDIDGDGRVNFTEFRQMMKGRLCSVSR